MIEINGTKPIDQENKKDDAARKAAYFIFVILQLLFANLSFILLICLSRQSLVWYLLGGLFVFLSVSNFGWGRLNTVKQKTSLRKIITVYVAAFLITLAVYTPLCAVFDIGALFFMGCMIVILTFQTLSYLKMNGKKTEKSSATD